MMIYTRPSTNDDHIIVTLGSGGALWNGMIYKPQPVKVFDVCGAGDTFLAALVYKFLKTRSMQNAINYANKAAAISVTHPGAYRLSKKDIDSIGEENES